MLFLFAAAPTLPTSLTVKGDNILTIVVLMLVLTMLPAIIRFIATTICPAAFI